MIEFKKYSNIRKSDSYKVALGMLQKSSAVTFLI